jgi:hypothetical protein
MTTPKNLTDLRFETVIRTTSNFETQSNAKRYFKDCEIEGDVKVRFLFSEEETNGDVYKVYESYVDSGSVDYIYLMEKQ